MKKFDKIFKSVMAFAVQSFSVMLLLCVGYACYTAFSMYGVNPLTVSIASVIIAAIARVIVPEWSNLHRYITEKRNTETTVKNLSAENAE